MRGIAMATSAGSVARATDTRATVFGLDVRADRPIPYLQGALAAPTSRALELLVRHAPLERDMPDSAAVICSREHRGTQSFRIEAHPEAGYLVWGAGCGSYRLSADARRLCCQLGEVAPDAWERFLIGQVLPFAALASGLEIFHASAVALDGIGVAFAGPSGAGKTSVALSLCDGGASFLADDVLALESATGELLAHPGAALAGVDQTEGARRRRQGRPCHGETLMSNPREQVVRVEPSAERVPLRALFFLERRPAGPLVPRFEPVTDPLALLAATFNFALATPRRLLGLLDVCALVAQRRVERILVETSLDASVLASAVERRLSAAA
jgi:hypothetical protein